jgi:sigma-E factor negative regulatory protein RseC
MDHQETITHSGIITKHETGIIYVSIIAQSACSACHAKGVCGMSEMQEKVVEIDDAGLPELAVGTPVTVAMKRATGLKAVLYGYFLPFVLLLTTLFVAMGYFHNEGKAGLLALAILLPYYLVLYMLRGKMKSGFEFSILDT